MATRPEFLVVASGGLVLAAGFASEGKFPKTGAQSLAAFGVLTLVVAAGGRTKVGSIVTALSWLFFLGIVYAVVPAFKNGQRGDAPARRQDGDRGTSNPTRNDRAV